MSDDTSEQERIGNDLGSIAHTLIMRNHGAVTVGNSIGEAFIRMWYLEKACRNQLNVMQTGAKICIPSNEVLEHTSKQYNHIPNPHGYSEWNPLVKSFMLKSFNIKTSPPPAFTSSIQKEQLELSHLLPIKVQNDDDFSNHNTKSPVAVRGKQYLVGGTGTAGGALFPSFIPQTTSQFPQTYSFKTPSSPSPPPSSLSSSSVNDKLDRKESIIKLGKNIREIIELELKSKGALLFKEMPNIVSADDFSCLMASIGYSTFNYSGGASSRDEKAKGVLTASNDPPCVSMEPHLEMAYNKSYPKKVFFFCHEAPNNHNKNKEGGETPIVNMENFHLSLPSAMIEKFRNVGVKYMRHLPSSTTQMNASHNTNSDKQQIYTWQSLFFSEDKLEVEKRCIELGYDFTWSEDDSLTWSYILPAFVKHTTNNKEAEEADGGTREEEEGEEEEEEGSWFNQATCLHHSYYQDYPNNNNNNEDEKGAYPTDTCYGDGTPFTSEEVQFMRARLWERAHAVSWGKGDLLVMDNTRVAHGRMSFSDDSKRSILVSLTGN